VKRGKAKRKDCCVETPIPSDAEGKNTRKEKCASKERRRRSGTLERDAGERDILIRQAIELVEVIDREARRRERNRKRSTRGLNSHRSTTTKRIGDERRANF